MKLGRRAHRALVPGFRFAGVRCGMKTKGPDVALIVADAPAIAAGVFTTNLAAAAPEKLETIRRDGEKVGRNDPCPCGSGKKYKKCHGQAA